MNILLFKSLRFYLKIRLVLIHSDHKKLSYYDMAYVLANSCLVTHPPDKEKHYHWLCNCVFTQSNKANFHLTLL